MNVFTVVRDFTQFMRRSCQRGYVTKKARSSTDRAFFLIIAFEV